MTSTGSGFGIGIATITRANDMNLQKNTQEIKGAFSDLESLKLKAKGIAVIANKINQRIQKKELSNDEMNDIQQVMFNMGMTDGFTSHVNKDISGKKFFADLAKELEVFLDKVISSERFSGVIGLVDLYCLYNRARGTDLISPKDMD